MVKHQASIQELTLEEVMGDRFGRYSKYIIQERALPDIRDGLKPVQRRILYAMYEDGNTYDKGFRKSAKSVGNIMGNYHPHGDSSIYEALVRMSQDFKLRDVLIEMHGNNGSMDGDPAAAMRYTESRLSKLSEELLADINKDTVDMVLNFDDSKKEPVVLPAKFPNLLVNGSTGISAGYATDIPTHNLGEVIDGTILLLENEDITIDELMNVIKGPDFPTGGILMGQKQLKEAYKTGKGKVVLRAKTKIESAKVNREQIIITEIPYEVNKANLVKKIDEIRIDKKIDGIMEVRDETDRNGLRIVIELKADVDSKMILNYLFKHTDLQINYNFNMVAIDNMRPKQVNLKQILSSYIEHRKNVILRRSKYELNKAMQRAHIVAGLIKALSILDKVIKTIRNSNNKKDAKNNLMSNYQFSEAQAEAIVMMQLYKLTNTDVTSLEKEALDLQLQVDRLQKIITDSNQLKEVIKDELLDVKSQYQTPRKTKIQNEIAELQINQELLISSEQTYVTVTKQGYYKRSSLRSYQSTGMENCGIKEDDQIIMCKEANTRDHLYLITNLGNLIYRQIYDIPEFRFKDIGDHLTQSITNLQSNEEVVSAFTLNEIKEDETFIFVTKYGYIKQTVVDQFKPWRTAKSKSTSGIKLKDNDEVIQVINHPIVSDYDLLVSTNIGYLLKYPVAEVSIQGPKAAGVKSINLKDGDFVVQTEIVPRIGGDLLMISNKGMLKRISLDEIQESSRSNRGVLGVKILKTTPHKLIYVKLLNSDSTKVEFIKYDKINEEMNLSDIPKVNRDVNTKCIYSEIDKVKSINIK